jgi:6-phosphogluconolactonase (cycloisomerase 2 family)
MELLGLDANLKPNDIWAADLRLTPKGGFPYSCERIASATGAFQVERPGGRSVSQKFIPTG